MTNQPSTRNALPRFIGSVLLAAASSGCTSVVMNDGQTVVVDWDQTFTPKDEAILVATKSCQQSGKSTAIEISNASSSPSLPAWVTTRKLAFRCE